MTDGHKPNSTFQHKSEANRDSFRRMCRGIDRTPSEVLRCFVDKILSHELNIWDFKEDDK